jgi:hypothetical protein
MKITVFQKCLRRELSLLELPDQIKNKIFFEFQQIEKLLNDYKPLIDSLKIKNPDLFEKTALGALLQSFYNGIEKIIIIIAKEFDKEIPKGIKWHSELLIQMNKKNEKRDKIFDGEEIEILSGYMKFRHYFSHSYTFNLDYSKMVNLIDKLHDTFKIIINKFK